MQHVDHLIVLPDDDRIVPMTLADLPAVHMLECASQRDPWSMQHFTDEFANPFSTIDIYWCQDVLAGFLCSWLIAGELQIQNLATLPDMRRRGVAERILGFVLERSRRSGLESASLEVRASNKPAIALYEKFGFVVTATRTAYYPDGEDALLMISNMNVAAE